MFFWKKDKARNFAKLSKSERETLARELLDEGNRHLEKGKLEAALERFRDLIRLEPTDADHRRRLADCHGRLGDKKAELEARCKAATLYAEAGFLLKGIAMCKLALAIDPSHRDALEQLAQLNELTGVSPVAPSLSPTFTDEEERTRKDEELAEARARVERVLAAREARAEAQKAARHHVVASEAKPPAGPPSAPAIELSDDDEDVFIAPLDEDDIDLDPAVSVPSIPRSAVAAPDNVALALRRVPLLSDLAPSTFVSLVDRVGLLELGAKDVLFRVGDAADKMYCVVEGEVAATIPGPDDTDLELARLTEGDFFGEIGLLAEEPRRATIRATSRAMLLVFERSIVSELSRSEPDFVKVLLRFVRERLVASLIATHPLFAPFGGSEARELTYRFQFLEVKPRKPLIRQGTPSGGVYVLLTGSARVVRSSDGEARHLGQLRPGDIFGEMSLINREAAVASVVTDQKCFVLELPAKDFTQLVMMHPALLDYISTLAANRQAQNETLISGGAEFIEDRLSLV